jgi:hypothetical protein
MVRYLSSTSDTKEITRKKYQFQTDIVVHSMKKVKHRIIARELSWQCGPWFEMKEHPHSVHARS